MENAAVILTKNRILEQIKSLLQQIEQRQLRMATDSASSYQEIFSIPPKISRGENYLGLPYLVLDYPRLSSGDRLFFIRTFFWWGNFFSVTLHLSGHHADACRARVASSYTRLRGYSLGIGPDPWAHHFEPSNYHPIEAWSEQEFVQACAQASHLKIARTLPLSAWPTATDTLLHYWSELLQIATVA